MLHLFTLPKENTKLLSEVQELADEVQSYQEANAKLVDEMSKLFQEYTQCKKNLELEQRMANEYKRDNNHLKSEYNKVLNKLLTIQEEYDIPARYF